MRRFLTFLILTIFLTGLISAADFEITIDAEKDEFYNTLTGPDDGWIFMSHEAWNNNGRPESDADYSANFWACWDDTFFYCYEEVMDDTVNLNNATNWANDCLELKFDPDPLAMEPVTGSGVFALRLTALDSQDVSSDVWSGVDNLYPEGNPYALTNNPDYYARRLTDVGYVVECKVPWADIYFEEDARGPVIAAEGEIFGMGIMNHDNDSDGRDGSIEWAAVRLDQVWNDVTLHGMVTFLPDHKLQFKAENFITGVVNDTTDYTPTAVETTSPTVPSEYQLSQNYPNPFNPTTHINYTCPVASYVTLRVFDVAGHEIATLVDGMQSPGHHKVTFDGADLGSGVYFYRLRANEQTLTRKMMLVK